ncbi:MAG: HAD hydrolase-like protein [Bacteroidales bacterium]|nr:HAD hydrolase-like protein [Bacteroidales bacterium]
MNPQEKLKNLKSEKKFFIGIDSDGCVFDTMEIKQKECFCPNFIKYWELQSISKYARETWEFVNLYSKTRGCNRFLAIIEAFALLKERKEVLKRNYKPRDIVALVEWTKKETKLGNVTLEAYARQVNNPVIDLALKWSKAVNKQIGEMVYGIEPFPYVMESIEKIQGKADTIVVSQTPVEALEREWKENNIAHLVKMIAGQEYGTKTEHIALTANGKYDSEKILMIGDAPGDLKAADANGALFFPINPGKEEESWERFYQEGIDRFFEGSFQGSYQQELLDEFHRLLPEKPSW